MYIYSQRKIFKFVIPSFSLNIKKFSITYNGPFLWNLLENKFKLFNNINTFTRRLKYNYISMFYNAEYNLFLPYFFFISYIYFYIFSYYIYFLNILTYFILNYIYYILFALIYFKNDEVITREWNCFIIYLFDYFLYNVHF